jgi:Zn-dependent protease with chaperone function
MAILATGSPPEDSLLPGYQVVSLFILKAWLFRQTIRFYQYRQKIRRLAEYFSAERNLVVLALILFGLDVYLLDLQYYLGLLPFSRQLPTLVDMVGIGVFLLYLVLLWLQLKRSYEEVIGVRKNALVHLKDKLRICVALVLPWLVVGFLHDLLLLIPNAKVQDFMASPWGEPLFLLVMIVAAVIWFPAVLVRLLGCTPMPDGELRSHVEQTCRQQGIRFGEICLWPIVEGKVLTAGVVGLVGRYRYLLITPALLTALAEEELEAVVAHEIGHVKKHHLLLYLLLFLGFGVLLQLCIQPLISLLLGTRLFYEFLFGYEGDPGLVLILLTGGALVTMTLIYFRYVFGFFMRNFERQADLYSLKVMGGAAPLVSVFKKIALLSGTGRDMPCWHHFSLGQRIDYLLSCQRDGSRPKAHHYKVYSCLAGYFVAIGVALLVTLQVGDRLIASYSGQQLAEEVILEKIERDPGNSLWHQFHGDLLVARKQYAEAINAFELSLQLYPDNPEALNNLAWLLLTVEKRQLLDPIRALELAEKAVEIQARSHILDTLAEAYWQNGMADMAIETAQRALEDSSGNREYYRQQLKKFSLGTRT